MKKTRHILNLSGGKDSTALAIYLRDKVPDIEYVFCDTQKELKETYTYLDRLEVYLGKPIVRLNAERGFDHWLEIFGGLLPSPQVRWCTRLLKLRPFEAFVGDDPVISYVALRADEDRVGYISTKPNIKPVFPFKEIGYTKADVFRILDLSGLGLPEYYTWRSRSGCYFCFFQRKIEWVGLLMHHPDLYKQAMQYEKYDPEGKKKYTWCGNESLDEIAKPERIAEIIRQAEKDKTIRCEKNRTKSSAGANRPLVEILQEEDEDDDLPCLICQL